MSVIVTISSKVKLNKAKHLLGTKTESETVERALEKVIEEFEKKPSVKDLPGDFFDNLFAENTNLADGESIEAVLKERQEKFERTPTTGETAEAKNLDIHKLNRISPRNRFKVTANFKIAGRRKPMKYDFSDFEENNL
ncbi:MAG: hypothetical protein LH472_15360 [Pyrinomonadaceae bacterium]|nr:hypothetical protein [Pyrinomonadaceae bacterium]